MKKSSYISMNGQLNCRRRDFMKMSGLASMGLVLGNPRVWASNITAKDSNQRIKTNIEDFLKIPRKDNSLPGLCPGKVVQVYHAEALSGGSPNASVIREMVQKGIEQLLSVSLEESFNRLFNKHDVVGIKVNPVGAGLISTRLEVADAVIDWLLENNLPRENIVIWDRFDYMLSDAGFTADRYPGIRIEGLQTMDEAAAAGESADNSKWLSSDGHHMSEKKFDQKTFYWADVDGPVDQAYLNQHVFNHKYSYYGKLVTKKLTKIINIPVFKNTGNGISMATKNIGYGVICNTGRLHRPLFFDVCTEVLAHPCVRDKLVLNITDGLRAQYEGGPMAAAQYTYEYKNLFFATDPFALDMICHQILLEKRKQMKIKVNEHPKFTEYLRYAEKLQLGVTNPDNIDHIKI